MSRVEIDPYSILGVSTHSSIEEVKAAYRRAARRLHPDVNSSPGAKLQFQDITAAHEILSDPTRRQSYDEQVVRRKAKQEGEYYFSLRVTPSKRTVARLQEPQVVYLLAEVLPDPRARKTGPKREARVNLTLVLDHSNSMNGTRLEKVKVAAHQIIDHLSDHDILSVIGFNDRAEVIIPATAVKDKAALKAKISMMVASGGTEIFQGLEAGVGQNRRFLAPKLVNHVILLTDGNTYGDDQACVELAHSASKVGIGISAMGLGQEWNDEFLDELASITGGTSSYIKSASEVVKFLNDHVRNLSDAFAERIQISIAPDPDVLLESAFKLMPQPQPLQTDQGTIPLGSLQANRTVSALFQIQLPADMQIGFRSLARLMVVGDILDNTVQQYQTLSDVSLEVMDNPPIEDPPISILDALGKLTLYRMQERAQAALSAGDVEEATRRLENLATRLLAMGESELATEAMSEAKRVAHTSAFSDSGRKTLKYQTRHLLAGPTFEDA
ncbi:MAG: DnaJ domain-containing protein [Anaerolineae bacterium]|nr:DnaJ domain-containing protein [Anaerolineae bacterium]